MTVGEIMTKNVITVDLDDTLNQIRELFNRYKFHHVLVLEDNLLVGIISDRDVLEQISPHVDSVRADARALNTLHKKAHQIMTRTIQSVTTDTSVEAASEILLQESISCLPVLSASGGIDGIVTWRDVLRYYTTKG